METDGNETKGFIEGRARMITILAATESETLRALWGPPPEEGLLRRALSLSVYCELRACSLLPTVIDTPIKCFRSAVQSANRLAECGFFSEPVFVAALALRQYVNKTSTQCICVWHPCRCGTLLRWARSLFIEGEMMRVSSFFVERRR